MTSPAEVIRARELTKTFRAFSRREGVLGAFRDLFHREYREVRAVDAAGQELSEDERKKYGSAIHWGLGVGAGAVYGALRDRVPGADWGNGLLFGTAFWALIDEGANTALGLTPGPSRFPWQTHARGLAGHLVFGLAADTALRLMDRVA